MIIYTDGACKGNPGPGGWACLIIDNDNYLEYGGSSKYTTNNIMEMTAALEALKLTKDKQEIKTIVTDSQYLKNGITQWIKNWKKNGWRTSSGGSVKNQELWQELDHYCTESKVEWKWVRGHSNDPNNNRADEIAQAFSQKKDIPLKTSISAKQNEKPSFADTNDKGSEQESLKKVQEKTDKVFVSNMNETITKTIEAYNYANENSKMMKIGITCYPGVGGSGILATELGIALAKKGHEIHFITSSPPVRLTEDFYENIFYHEVEVIDYPVFKSPPYSLSLASKMAEIVLKHKLDILHVHYAIPHAASAYFAKQMCCECNLKFITTLHGTDVTLVGSQPVFLPITRFCINSSDGVTAVSNHLRDVTREIFGVTREIEVIYNFVDTERFKPAQNIQRRRKYASDDHKILIHLSNFRPVKQVLNTIRVFNEVQKVIPSVLLMAGDGVQWSEAVKLADELGLQNSVRFLGKINPVERLLPLSDLFVLNSVKESFGLAVLEAAACGVPAAVTNIGGLPEVVEDQVTGIIAPAEDVNTMALGIIELLSNEEKLNKMKKAARKKAVDYFDSGLIVPQYEEYYRRVISRNR